MMKCDRNEKKSNVLLAFRSTFVFSIFVADGLAKGTFLTNAEQPICNAGKCSVDDLF